MGPHGKRWDGVGQWDAPAEAHGSTKELILSSCCILPCFRSPLLTLSSLSLSISAVCSMKLLIRQFPQMGPQHQLINEQLCESLLEIPVALSGCAGAMGSFSLLS